MKEKNSEKSVYLKFEYPDSLESKKDILYSQKSLVEMNVAMKEYFLLKDKEVRIKSKLKRKIREFIICIDSINKIMPEVEKPKILRKEELQINKILIKKAEEGEKTKRKKSHYEDSIESQLREIQEKLDRIGKA